MSSLLRSRAISLLPKFHFLPSRSASSSQLQIQKSADSSSAHNSCIDQVPCPTRKLESSSSSPCSIRTDAINISKAVDSAVQRLKQDSEEDYLIQENDLSVRFYEYYLGSPCVCFKIKAPGENIEAHIDISERHIFILNVSIVREDGCHFQYEDFDDDDDNVLSYEGTWKSWQNYLQCSKQLKSDNLAEVHVLMRERADRHVQRFLPKRGINESENPLLTAYPIVENNHRRRAEQLAWMQNVKDFMLN